MPQPVFVLFAGAPDPKRDPAYWETADLISIRDAATAIASSCLQVGDMIVLRHTPFESLLQAVKNSLNGVGTVSSIDGELSLPEEPTAAFFIGGMERVEQGYDYMRTAFPNCPRFVFGTTGGAASGLSKRDGEADIVNQFRNDLDTSYSYIFMANRIVAQLVANLP